MPSDAGAAAIVLQSLFQEQIEAEAESLASRVDVYAEGSPEAASSFPAAVSGPYCELAALLACSWVARFVLNWRCFPQIDILACQNRLVPR
jgi:hypothetical protein